MNKTAREARRLLVSGFALLGAALSAYVTFTAFALTIKLLALSACGLIVAVAVGWPIVKRWQVRALRTAMIAVIAFVTAWAQWHFVNADTIRIGYAKAPTVAVAIGSFLIEAGPTAETLLLDCYVLRQEALIVTLDQQVGPPGAPAKIGVTSLTEYDRQVVLTDFVRKQYAQVTFTLSSPALFEVERLSKNLGPVLFQEDLTWYLWAVRAYFVVVAAGGALLSWWRSS